MIRVSPYVYPGMPQAFIESAGQDASWAIMIRIMNTVCQYYNITAQAIKGRRNTNDVVKARYSFIWLALNHTDNGPVAIGRYARKDHSTILHAKNKMKAWLNHPSGDWIKPDIKNLEEILAKT